MSELLNRSAFKKAILSKAERAGKRVIGQDGKVEKGIRRIPDEAYREAVRILYETMDRWVAIAHPTRSTLEIPLTKEQVAAAGCGPQKRRRS